MPSLSHYRIAVAVASSGALAAFFLSKSDRFRVHASSSPFHVELQEAEGRRRSTWDRNWDRMDPSAVKLKDGKDEKEVAKSTASRHLILIRHGQYEQWHSDHDKRVLTEMGRKQARATGERLKTLGENYTIIYHSTMPRATETAQLVAESLPNVPMKSCDLMREGAPYAPDPPSRHWKPELHEFFRDGARIEAAFRKYFHRASPSQKEDSTEVLVCHANVIRYFVCRALQLPPEAWLRMSLGNGSITRFTIRPNGNVTLKTLGNYGHFPPHLITFN